MSQSASPASAGGASSRARAGPEGQRLAVPAHAALGRQDGPAHRREAAREEGRRRLDDVVLGLEPGDVQRRAALAVARSSRKRTKAFILCMSRRTACAICSACTRSASSGSPRSAGSTCRRQSRRYSRPKRAGSRCSTTLSQSGMNAAAATIDRRRVAGASPSAVSAAGGVASARLEQVALGVVGRCASRRAPARTCARPQRAAGAPEAVEVGRARQRDGAGLGARPSAPMTRPVRRRPSSAAAGSARTARPAAARPRWRRAGAGAGRPRRARGPAGGRRARTNGSTLRSGTRSALQVGRAQAAHRAAPAACGRPPSRRGPARAAASPCGARLVDRKALAVRQRPGELRVDVEREHAGVAGARSRRAPKP